MSLDVADKEEPKYQIRNPYELFNAITTTDDKYNDCFLLHLTIPAQFPDDCIQIIHGTDDSILQQPHSIGHCISADAQMSKGFAELLSQRIPGLRDTCRRTKLLTGQAFPFWDQNGNRYIYNLVTKTKCSEKPNQPTLSLTLEEMKSHARLYGLSIIAIPKIGCGLHQMNWQEVVKLLRDIFAYSNIRIVVYTLKENGDPDFYAEDEIERYSEEFYLNDKDLETDFTRDANCCQTTCDEHFHTFREKDYNNQLIEHYLQYQPKELVKEFDFQFPDITDEEMTLLIDMLIDSKDVYSQQKFDVGDTRQKFHVTLKPNVELKSQRLSKVPLHLKEKLEKLLYQLKNANIIREMGNNDEMGSLFVNPIILMPKSDYVELVIDARFLSSVTDLTNYSWPLETVQIIMTRVNGKFFSVSGLSCAYH